MTCRMGEFVECSAVVLGHTGELFLQGKLNAISVRRIEGFVAFGMFQRDARVDRIVGNARLEILLSMSWMAGRIKLQMMTRLSNTPIGGLVPH